ncbi:iron-sulfur cluster carrier protein ApbC [Vibrio algivorus]|uniref:Iron-sulfur cluster carrier protein n=1 Tax=Vibrio algivorus TaxID=1667024 RepID=A0A557P6W2_9VIBR|nr:iron-sulfur cluster carrier protein ApbC [Vibrio algivorus]TVO36391.1 iron-sulfur cluster carrier protein ApbC [Vibrio algivorus]GLT15777.1 iron-sulfur cluster carrier protein [Vibrio algivorus]
MSDFSSHSLLAKDEYIHRLNQFEHEALIENWAEIPSLVQFSDEYVNLVLPFYYQDLKSDLQNWCDLQTQQDARFPKTQVSVRVKPLQAPHGQAVKGVKNIIAVTSAKGGVGKSTTAVNLALALQALGAKVGLLDADIYGPSVPLMLGTQGEKPGVRDNKWMIPVEAHGLYTNSIGYLIADQDAAIWRGPMASKALAQILNETLWPDLDYLVIDMPPGTGDIQLTLSQQVPVTAALVVTTPQDLALADARKGVTMFEQVEVPVLGIIENMSYHICSQCGHHEAIFGQGGAQKMAQDASLTLLSQIPLHIDLRSDIDNGCPTVAARPDSEHSQIYLQLASHVAANLFWQGKPRAENIMFVDVS